MRRWERVNGVWEGFQQAGLIISQDRFSGRKPVDTQNEIRGKAIGNEEREAGVITTVVMEMYRLVVASWVPDIPKEHGRLRL